MKKLVLGQNFSSGQSKVRTSNFGLIVFNISYKLIINVAIFCHGTSLKKHLATWGLELASSVSVNRHAMLYTIMHPQKKDASSPELSNTVLSHLSYFNSHIMTDAIFCYVANQYYCTVVYILIIYIAIFCHEHHWKKPIWQRGQTSFWGCMMVQSIACLLTQTGDAGSSLHVVRWIFLMMFRDKILL